MARIFDFYRNKKINNFGIFVVAFLTVLLATVFISSYQNILCFEKKIITKKNIEDFTFYPNTTQISSSKEENTSHLVDDLANTYNFTWEDHKYTFYSSSDTLYRIYSSERLIDKFLIIEGEMINSNDETMIDYLYAKEHNLSKGDKIKIKGKEYLISAIVVLPDMINPIVDDSGKLYDKEDQAILIMNEDVLNQIGTVKHSYVGKFNGLVKSDVIKKMKEDTNFSTFTEVSNNSRILGSLFIQKKLNLIILGFSVGILSSIVVLMILISISESISKDYKKLGVLKALGYTNFEVCRRYLNYFTIVGFSTFLGYTLGKIIAVPFFKILYSNYSIPYIKTNFFDNILFLVFIPTLFCSIVALFYSMQKVRKPALSMIVGKNNKNSNIMVQILNKYSTKADFLKQTRKKLLFSRMIIVFFVAFSGFAFTVQALFAYSTYNISNNIVKSVMSEYGYKNKVIFLSEHSDDLYNDSLKFYVQRGQLLVNDDYLDIELYELNDDNLSLLKLTNSEDDSINITETDGVVINKWMSIKYNLRKGDTISISINGKKYNLKVGEVSQSVYGSEIYVSNEYLNRIIERSGGNFIYNGILTNESISFNDKEHLSIVSKDEISNMFSKSNQLYRVFSIMLFICGMVIGLTVLIMALYSVIENNKKNISLMKLIGYSDKECDYLVINSYRFVVIIGYVIALPYTYVLCSIMFNMLTKNSNVAYLVNINIFEIICCLIFIIIITEVSLKYFKSKLKKVTFKEILEE